MRGAHPFLDPKWSRIPASKRAPDAVEEAWQLWNPVWTYFAPDIPTSSPLLSRSLSCFSSYLRHRRDIFSYFHPPIVSSLAWTQGKNDANETLFLWDNVGEKRWINDGCNLYRWKEQLLRCITLICRWNIRIYRSLKKNVYFVLILRLFLFCWNYPFFFFIKLSFTCSKKDKEQSRGGILYGI